MAIDTTAPRTRRAILGAALGGAGAVALGTLARPDPAQAATGDDVVLGKGVAAGENEADAVTLVKCTTEGGVSLAGAHAGAGTGLEGTSVTGTGMVGRSTDTTATEDWGATSHKTGVFGTAGDTTEAAGNTDESGVYGYASLSDFSTGVWGDSMVGSGVYGTGPTGVYGDGFWGVYGTGVVGVLGDVLTSGTGVYGYCGNDIAPAPPAGTAVYARAQTTSQTALSVSGKARFSRSGRVSIGGSASSKTFSMAGVTTSSYIIATMQTSVSGVYVRAVIPGSGSFKIQLSKAAGKKVFVGFLVIN